MNRLTRGNFPKNGKIDPRLAAMEMSALRAGAEKYRAQSKWEFGIN
jgi:hypothetical protein